MTYSTDNRQQIRMSYPPTDYENLKQLLSRTVKQNNIVANALSPNGTFKYIDRECAKYTQRRYSSFGKPLLTTQDRVRRPLNCFMVFSHLERKRVAEENPELHNADLSKILGKKWKNLTTAERQPYIDEAERIRVLHTEIYPDYKYQPRRKGQGKRGQRKQSAENQHAIKDECLSDGETNTSDIKIKNEGDKSDFQKEIPVKVSLPFTVLKNPSRNADQYLTETASNLNKEEITAHKGDVINQLNIPYEAQKSFTEIKYSCSNPNPPLYMLTPELSPASCYKEPVFNTPVHNRITGMQSLPLTPEVSPKQICSEESVFTFDSAYCGNNFVHPQLMKSHFNAHHQQQPIVNESYEINGNKDNFVPPDYHYYQNGCPQQTSYYHGDFQPNPLSLEYFQQHVYDQGNYSFVPNQINYVDTTMINNFGLYRNNMV